MALNTQANNILSNPQVTKIPPFLSAKSYGADNICKFVKNENSKLMTLARGQAHLLIPINELRATCAKPQFTNKQAIIKTKWDAFLKVLKTVPAAASAPVVAAATSVPLESAAAAVAAVTPAVNVAAASKNSLNTIFDAIGALERNVQTLKSRVQTFKSAAAAAGGKRRKTRKSRSRF